MKLVPNSLTRTVATSILKAKKNSPAYFFVGGIVGVVGTTVLACRATLKLEDTLDEIKKDFANVEGMSTYTELGESSYNVTQYRRDVGYVVMRGTVKIGKLYGPSIILGTASIAALTGSHVQLTRRNAALTATLAAVMEAFEAYRTSVREELGEDRERELYFESCDKAVIELERKSGSKERPIWSRSPYARRYDAYNPNWMQSSELNRNFLTCQQKHANDQLRARGFVMLNDVYDSLGFDRTSAGCIVGWVRDGKDGYIDFGIFEAMNNKNVGDLEPSLWLDFNVDGIVYELIGDGHE